MKNVEKWLPALVWLRTYNKTDVSADVLASLVVTIMLIPQSLAYAMLAGLPLSMGLYASILPLIAYAVFGSSRTLAVGPVAVVSMMTGTAAASFAIPGSEEYVAVAILLSVISGLFLILLGGLKLGFFANLLSHPVISGFITASAIVIAISQMKHILGISIEGHALMEVIPALFMQITTAHLPTFTLGVTSITVLLFLRFYLATVLIRLGFAKQTASLLSKTGPVIVVILSTLIVSFFALDTIGIGVVGSVPTGFPSLQLPDLSYDQVMLLLPSAALISIVGFVESVSVAQSFAAKQRQSINPNQELIGLGCANIASSLSSGFPVTGGFSRSVVSFDAGAKTPMTGVFSAILILMALTFFTSLFYFLPKAVLSATIIVAVLSLVDLKAIKDVWGYSKHDSVAMIGTIMAVLFYGVEVGITTGVGLSILMFLWHTSHPHIAVVGQVTGTEHFRNVERFNVEVHESILTLRVDENLYFANARVMEDKVAALVAEKPNVTDVILMCTAINMIDASALDSLEAISDRLQSANIKLHLSEVKGPVMDKLKESDLIKHLSGNVYLTQYQAVQSILNNTHPT
ncbi:SulP family inorganic anion transporter [Marinomonas algicola]|uniref:SulP family inorganic anion transporter n=1 Tax=Marinomonas algicola TaxID=2773454 RepID=UPI00174C1082|nr:sulfate permease [Marinomonas algicola]